VPPFEKNEALFEKIDALFEKIEALFEKKAPRFWPGGRKALGKQKNICAFRFYLVHLQRFS